MLDGGQSHDIDGHTLSYRWELAEKPETSDAVLVDDQLPQCRLDIDKPGHYAVRLIVNDGELDSQPDLIEIDTQNSAPVADAGPDQNVYTGDTVQLDGSQSYDIDGDVLNYAWSLSSKPEGSQSVLQQAANPSPLLTPDLPRLYVSQLIVSDYTIAGTPDTAVITAESRPVNHAPVIDSEPVTEVGIGQTYLYSVQAHDPDADPLSYTLTGAPAGMIVSAAGTVEWLPDTAGDYPVVITVADGNGGATAQSYTIAVTDLQDPALPPDPASVATPLGSRQFTPLAEAIAFLYSGENPIQPGVNAGTINAKRAAVIRGSVSDQDNQPLPGVSISIKDHPEFGQTLSRTDGQFDLAVNGGGLLTVNNAKTGFLPLQRNVRTPWQDYAHADDTVMIPLDPNAAVIDLNDLNLPFQVARGSVETDSDGTRQATVLFPRGATAEMVLADGSLQPLTTLTVRATEYTVGANGPQRMPGPLPPTSGYTYAVELSADEAIAANAERVTFQSNSARLCRQLPKLPDRYHRSGRMV